MVCGARQTHGALVLQGRGHGRSWTGLGHGSLHDKVGMSVPLAPRPGRGTGSLNVTDTLCGLPV